MKRCMELQRLSRDHHLALVVAKKVRQLVENEGSNEEMILLWTEIQKNYKKDMELHFELEEKILLPAINAAGLETHVERILFEHQEMRDILAQDLIDSAGMQAFSRLLKDHVRFEERELFSAAEELLSESALKDIQGKLEAA
ncbi:MAG: hemerythrin domain-containing protein [Gammaproteobacteria bacterium]|nr:hemerythrin domain-containing protein [Gammaproteobacteria bacterium]